MGKSPSHHRCTYLQQSVMRLSEDGCKTHGNSHVETDGFHAGLCGGCSSCGCSGVDLSSFFRRFIIHRPLMSGLKWHPFSHIASNTTKRCFVELESHAKSRHAAFRLPSSATPNPSSPSRELSTHNPTLSRVGAYCLSYVHSLLRLGHYKPQLGG